MYFVKELIERFFQKIYDDWETKYKNFAPIQDDNFSHLNLSAFIKVLHNDINETLLSQLPDKSKASKIIPSEENLRRILTEKPVRRLHTNTKDGLSYYVLGINFEGFKAIIREELPKPVIVVQPQSSWLPMRASSPKQKQETIYDAIYETVPQKSFWKSIIFKQLTTSVISLLLLGFGAYFGYRWYKNRRFTPEQLAKVKFDLIQDYAKPNSNHFKIRYDVSSLNTDSVVIDYGLDYSYLNDFPQKGSYKEIFNKQIDTISHTYFKPGIWQVKLIVGNQVVRTIQRIVYTGDKWTGYADGFNAGKNWEGRLKSTTEIIDNGILHFSKELLDEPNWKVGFWTNLLIVKNLQIDGDSATVEARIKNNYYEGGIKCFDSILSLKTDKNNEAMVHFLEDCIEFGQVDIANTNHWGWKENLPFMGVNLQEWQVIRLKMKSKIAFLYVNDREIYRSAYQGDLGNIKEILFNFKGSGAVDWVKLSNSYTDKVIFSDDFVR